MPQALIERCKFQYLNNCKLFIYHHVAIQKTLSRLSFLDLGFFSPRSNSFLILSPPEHPSSKYCFREALPGQILTSDMAQKVATARKMKSQQEATSLDQIATVMGKPTISDKHL